MKNIYFFKKKKFKKQIAIFISDLHLHVSLPNTTQAFFNLLKYEVIRAQRLYLLGDIFEYWAGDDDMITPYNHKIIDALRYLYYKDVQVFLLTGNRDFLIGPEFAKAANLKLLKEPHIIQIKNRNIVLIHGDAQCTDDINYMKFRIRVHQLAWQKKFLAIPLSQRKTIIENFRKNNTINNNKSNKILDLNTHALRKLYDSTQADVLIHGHTHRPALHHHIHEDDQIRLRYVLPDWEYDKTLIRGGWISLMSDGTLYRFDANGNLAI